MKGEGEGKGKKGLERVLGRRLQWSAGVGEHLVEVGLSLHWLLPNHLERSTNTYL